MHLPTPRILLLLLALTTPTLTPDFDWNCANSPETCNNACYAVSCAVPQRPSLLTYDAARGARPGRRNAAGCSRALHPCTDPALAYRLSGNSCDEYPFASTQEGGGGAILRCVALADNASQGGQLGAFYRHAGGIPNGHQFNIFIRNYANS